MVNLGDLSDDEIRTFINNYVASGKTSGGVFDLPTLRRELARRNGSGFSGKDVVRHILELSRKNSDELATYKELYERLYPGKKWQALNSLGLITKALDAAIVYCHAHSLPVVTVLIVNGADRKLTPEAKANIFKRCRELGFETGVDAESFVSSQIDISKRVALDFLPDA